MKPRLLPFTLFLLLSGGAASAEVNVNALAAELQAQGFTRIEMRETPNQLKVEAIRGTEKVETVYDKSTGAVLKSETGTVGAFENTSPSVTLRQRNRDFVELSDGESSDDTASAGGSSVDEGVSGSDDGPNHDANDDKGSDDSGSDSSHDSADHDSTDHDSADHDSSGHDSGDSGAGGSDDGGDSHGSDGSGGDGGGSGGNDGGEGSGDD